MCQLIGGGKCSSWRHQHVSMFKSIQEQKKKFELTVSIWLNIHKRSLSEKAENITHTHSHTHFKLNQCRTFSEIITANRQTSNRGPLRGGDSPSAAIFTDPDHVWTTKIKKRSFDWYLHSLSLMNYQISIWLLYLNDSFTSGGIESCR